MHFKNTRFEQYGWVLFSQNDVFKLMFLVTSWTSVSSKAFGQVWFLVVLIFFFSHFKSVYLLSLTVSPCLLVRITDKLHNHCRGALLTTGLHLAHSPKNSLLSQSDLTLLCNMDQCTIHISCILISFGARCLKSVGFFFCLCILQGIVPNKLPPSRVSKWKNSREGDRRVCPDVLFTTYVLILAP